jgi:hypothetical protein
MKFLTNPAPKAGRKRKGARIMAKAKKRKAASRKASRRPKASRARARARFRRNPPSGGRSGGVFNDALLVPVRGAAIMAGMAAARAAVSFVPAPAAGQPARSPLLPFAVGLGAALALQFAGSAIRGKLPKELLTLAAGGAAANAGKNLVTAYIPEAQTFLGRHDDVMYFQPPRTIARMATMNGYARPVLAAYPSRGTLGSYPSYLPVGY